MKLIVEGAPQDIQFVTAICRDQVRRGKLTLTPVTDTVNVIDSKDVEVTDSKDIPEADDKKPKGAKRTKKTE